MAALVRVEELARGRAQNTKLGLPDGAVREASDRIPARALGRLTEPAPGSPRCEGTDQQGRPLARAAHSGPEGTGVGFWRAAV
jgi:hypothetical protein